MVKKVVSSLVVFVVLACLWGNVAGIGGKPNQKAGGSKQKAEVKSTIQNERLKPKFQRHLGTPTVQQLLDKVKANYSKIQDLKADMVATIERPGGWGYPILKDKLTQEGKYYFKAPDKLKFKHPTEEKQTIIFKQQTKHIKDYEKNKVISYRLPWYLLLDPDHLPFYWRLDEIITKFDTEVISNPEPDIWVIEAVPKANNPDDMYNYPLPTMKLKIYVDYNKGIITKIGRKYSERLIQNFSLINNVWVPTKFVKTRFKIDFTVNTKEEITLSNIQLNTGIPDSEFEF